MLIRPRCPTKPCNSSKIYEGTKVVVIILYFYTIINELLANRKLFPGNYNEYPNVVKYAGSVGGAVDTHTNVYNILHTLQHYATSTDKLIAYLPIVYSLVLRNRALSAPLTTRHTSILGLQNKQHNFITFLHTCTMYINHLLIHGSGTTTPLETRSNCF